MAGGYTRYPDIALSANPSVGPINTPIPLDATLIGGSDGTTLRPVSVDSTGKLNVNISSSVLPAGGATAANQVLEIADLDSINTKLTSQATAANQTLMIADLNDIDTNTGNIQQAYVEPNTVYTYDKAAVVAGINLANDNVIPLAVSSSGYPLVKNWNGDDFATEAAQVTQSALLTHISSSIHEDGEASLTTGIAIGGLNPTGHFELLNTDASGNLFCSLIASTAVIGHVIVDSGAINATLQAGSNIIGNVRIDQTTPGTTNAVQANAGTNLNTSLLALEATQVKMPLAQASTTSGQSGPLVQGAVTTAAPTYTTGQTNPLSLTVEGRVRAQIDNSPTVFSQVIPAAGTTSQLTRAASTALATSLVVKAGAGRLYSVVITNTRTSSQFIQVHDATSLPSNSAVPIHSFYAPAQTSFSLDETLIGDYYATGITVCNSSTVATLTVGSSDCWFVALYK